MCGFWSMKRMVRCVLATGLCLLALGASAAEQPAGARLRGFVSVASRPNKYTIWTPFNSSSTTWTDAGTNAEILYDVGTPHALSGLGFVPRNDSNTSIQSRCKNMKVYGMTNRTDSVSKGTLLFNSGNGPWTLGNVVNWLDAQAELKPYRYYKITCNANPNFHVQFYSDDPMITQNRCTAWDWTKPAAADSTRGVEFTGSVVWLPDGGTADVQLMVARSDHDDDFAAWTADATRRTFSVSGLAQDSTYKFHTNDERAYGEALENGRWFARVFLIYGGKQIASNRSTEFVVGSSDYIPVSYFAQGQGSQVASTYDGTYNNFPDKNLSPCRVIWALEDVDRELVAIRFWPRGNQDQNGRCLPTRFLTSPSVGSLGAVTYIKTVNDHVINDAELDPVSDWKLLTQMTEQDLYVYKAPETYFEIPVTLPDRHTRYIKMDGFSYYNISEVAFRTLPRPAAPEATMAVEKVGGSYIGLTGFLDYRGNGSTNCDIYVACTKTGETPDYKHVGTGWENETPWSGTASKLQAETAYTVSVIVSNQTTGVEVLSTNVTTGVYQVEPPDVALVTVTPNADGTVSFAWNAVTLGTDADTCDLFVSWGADAEHQETPVKLTTISQTGAGAASLDVVPMGTNLVFVLTPKNDQETVGTTTQSETVELPGPSAFESTSVAQGTIFGLKATGRLAKVGLGTTDVYINWGTTEGVFDHWQKIGSYDATSASLAISGDAAVGAIPFCWARLVASNAFKTTSWVVPGDTFRVLFGSIPPANLTCGSWIAGYVQLYTDGDYTTCIDAKGPYNFDFGSIHILNGLKFSVRTDGTWTDQTKTMSVQLSTNGVDWTCAWSNDTGKAMAAGGKKHEIIFADLPKARYARVTCVNPSSYYMDFCELAFLTMDMTLTAYETRTWGSAANAPAAHDDRGSSIYFSGKICYGGPAHVYGCVAKEDWREDLAAWQAHGRVVDLGVHSAGEAISGTLPMGEPGLYRARLVAITEGQVACSPEVQIVPLNTRVYKAPAYIPSANVSFMKTVYDGAVGTCVDNGTWSDVLFKLDPSRYRALAVRFWPRYGDAAAWARPCAVKIAMTTDKSELVSEEYCATPRPIRTYASNTLTGWKDIANVQYRGDLLANPQCWDIPLQNLPKDATYLKVYNVENNNYREVEVRVVPPLGFVFYVR